MSEFKNTRNTVSQELIDFSMAIINAENPADTVRKNRQLMDEITPSAVLALVDHLVQLNIPMPVLKTGVNKLLNLFHTSLKNNPGTEPGKDSFIDYLLRNNAEMDMRLKDIRPLIRKINQDKNELEVKRELLKLFSGLEIFDAHYVIKENVLFPVLEKHWPDYRCLQVMWSFHDDIRRNRKEIINVLKKVELDLKKFNELAGDLFFNMLAIKFREEKILFPLMQQSIPAGELKKMLDDSRDLKFPYVQPDFEVENPEQAAQKINDEVELGTGLLSVKQIILLFNHLPVDITYVDEYNKVKYFSSPKHRIFPRAKGIVGRDVRNCHPPESIDIVEEIIEEFRSGRQDKASFWIKMGEVYILIQYFALRDEKNKYCGVVEVSQEISEIREIKGERRLLEWNTDKF
ncbi:MAG: DUF438 domain-containing protein [Bacteroidetes bacterium]|nr:DUF438 domain-containing protein [Bacteroidota bacterium]